MNSISGSDKRWQYKLLPYMIGTIIGLTVVFVGISIMSLANINAQLNNSPRLQVDSLTSIAERSTSHDKENLIVAMQMDYFITSSRYHQARIITMTNIIIQYFGFLTGMILAIIGSVFILGKIKEDVTSIDLKDLIKFTITSSSPGIMLAFFGTILMIFTLNVKHSLDVRDDAVYLKPAINVTLSSPEPGTRGDWDRGQPDTTKVSAEKAEELKNMLKSKYGKDGD